VLALKIYMVLYCSIIIVVHLNLLYSVVVVVVVVAAAAANRWLSRSASYQPLPGAMAETSCARTVSVSPHLGDVMGTRTAASAAMRTPDVSHSADGAASVSLNLFKALCLVPKEILAGTEIPGVSVCVCELCVSQSVSLCVRVF